MDLYAREKSKSRPGFAPDLPAENEIYEFYVKRMEAHRYLIRETYESMNVLQLL